MRGPSDIRKESVAIGVAKTKRSLESKLILGFVGGALVALGYLAYIRVAASFADSQPAWGNFLGACVFPIGLIAILLAGGELATGNMMVVSTAAFDKKISWKDWLINILTITLANFVGAIFVAFVFGQVVGLTTGDIYAQQVFKVADAKVSASVIQCFFSGIGCNWLVGLAIWLCFGAKDAIGKIVGIWFPIMIFIVIGFQHSIANIFVVSAAIFQGHGTWAAFFQNFIPVYLGNVIGGMIFMAFFYHRAYREVK